MSHIGPINWLSLSSLFILSYMRYIFINYYSYMVRLVSFSSSSRVNFITVNINYNNNFFNYSYLIKSIDNIYYDENFMNLSDTFGLEIVPSYNYSIKSFSSYSK